MKRVLEGLAMTMTMRDCRTWCVRIVGMAAMATLGSVAHADSTDELARWAQDVGAAERQFAQAMADRDIEAFARFVAQDAVFRDGKGFLVGREAVVEGWRELFKPGPAPFSWEPDRVTVDRAGTTAVSSGPVRDAAGKVISRFTTVWRRETDGDGAVHWRAVVDQGVPLVECGRAGGG
ncbi:MAG TPA: nuclear transport factor 2 family protein [Burkholderiaceae bacterium]|nr:nuclear transport factor 2 family protein [Burkholderiaceae bacterium]